ncbi:hypothetical protein BpHYR1_042836 [Brachionus plicatilis]|uniref:Uncharacterized protein n=1 Tax=Brachionus plicatilis TaxID=10195 RepID=A0A3M7RQZ2_BRAPC|nr:hypothetical protein BpHYR1_042836 [Brachionus plicatilis]
MGLKRRPNIVNFHTTIGKNNCVIKFQILPCLSIEFKLNNKCCQNRNHALRTIHKRNNEIKTKLLFFAIFGSASILNRTSSSQEHSMKASASNRSFLVSICPTFRNTSRLVSLTRLTTLGALGSTFFGSLLPPISTGRLWFLLKLGVFFNLLGTDVSLTVIIFGLVEDLFCIFIEDLLALFSSFSLMNSTKAVD